MYARGVYGYLFANKPVSLAKCSHTILVPRAEILDDLHLKILTGCQVAV
jgi:hypothetical protein